MNEWCGVVWCGGAVRCGGAVGGVLSKGGVEWAVE